MGSSFISKSYVYLYTRKQNNRDQSRIPVAMIRSMGFLSLFGTNLFRPFFPLYSELMSRPILGLSREFVRGLPIAVYMFVSTIGYILKDRFNRWFGYRGCVIAHLLCSLLIGFFYQDGMIHQYFEYAIAVIGGVTLVGTLIFAAFKTGPQGA